MKNLSSGIKNVAGDRLRKILHYLTINRVMGIIAGTGITCLLQSSSAVTVMVVGFVNAGLMALKQAISVIMGANIGTTLTAWIVASISWFGKAKISAYALPLIALGFGLTFFCKSGRTRSYGYAILGLGVLFLGLAFMKDAFGSLEDSDLMERTMVKFAEHPILGVLVGTFFTIILQSSSATIAVVQVLALNGLISFQAAIPIILGDNIGTTITAQIAAIGGNSAARRSAMAHSMFNIIGVAYMLIFIYTGLYARMITAMFRGITADNVVWAIAASHSIFNIANTLVFIPFIGWLERLTTVLVRTKPSELDAKPKYLEEHLLSTPPLALEQTRREIIRMTKIARTAFNEAVEGFLNNDRRILAKVAAKEEAVDNLQTEITRYLIALSRKRLNEESSQKLPVLLHTVNDIERVSDHAENLVEIAEKKIDQRLETTQMADSEIRTMVSEADAMIADVMEALAQSDHALARRALKREENINRMQMEFRSNHIDRLNRGECGLLPGLVFMDMLANIEKIGDHLTNVAQAVLGNLRWNKADEAEEPIVSDLTE
jgi:phosphate:Na+ symporter